MLTRARRIVNPLDFKRVVRRGRRATGAAMTIYVLRSDTHSPARCGFVVAKTVGGAVTRNLVKRRLRGIAQGLELPAGTDVIVRAHPASAQADYVTLATEFIRLVAKAR